MRRRILVSFLVVSAGFVAITALSLALIADAENESRQEHAAQVQAMTLVTLVRAAEREIAATPACRRATASLAPSCRARLLNLLSQLRNAGVDLVILASNGTVIQGRLPNGQASLSPSQLGVIQAGRPVTGSTGDASYALVPLSSSFYLPEEYEGALPAIAISLPLQRSASGAFYYLLAGLIALGAVASYFLANRIATRLSGQLESVVRAARRIASGDFRARVEGKEGLDRELAQLADAINSMASEIERIRGEERRLLYSVSHDLRTPLTSIAGYAEAIEDGTVAPVEGARIIQQESARLKRMVEELLDLARIQTATLPLHIRRVPLDKVVAQALESLAPTLAEREVAVHSRIEEGLAVYCDEDALARILHNLVDNAAKAARSLVSVEARSVPEGVLLAITDDGPGIPEEEKARIFQPFFKKPLSQGEHGAGLGLSIVKGLADLLGLTLEVASPVADGHGSSFRILLPRAPAHAAVGEA